MRKAKKAEKAKTIEPGFYLNMNERDYHGIPLFDAIGSSAIKKFHDQPSSILVPTVVSEDMNLGSAQDAYSLTSPEYFHEHFVVMPDFGDQRKKENNKAATAFQIENLGKTFLPKTVTPQKIPTMKAIEDVDNALFNEHPATKDILRGGKQQVSMFWKDEETGLMCKSRPDHYPDDATNTIVDLKKCGQINRFMGQINSLRYFLQAGHYAEGAHRNGNEVSSFIFIAFNFGDPPQIRVVLLGQEDDYLDRMRDLSKTTIRLINECKTANHFPDYKIPFETQSMAKMLGIKSDIMTQLMPYELIEIARPPYDFNKY